MFWIIRAGVRSAARAGSKPKGQKPKEWPPLGKAVFAFAFFGILCEICGWEPVVFTTLGLVAVSLLIALPAVANQRAVRAKAETARKRAEDTALDDLFTDKGAKR